MSKLEETLKKEGKIGLILERDERKKCCDGQNCDRRYFRGITNIIYRRVIKN